MVDDENAEAAYNALKMVIAGLAEQVLELAAANSPATAQGRISEMSSQAQAGRDLTLAADAAAMALARAYSTKPDKKSSRQPF